MRGVACHEAAQAYGGLGLILCQIEQLTGTRDRGHAGWLRIWFTAPIVWRRTAAS